MKKFNRAIVLCVMLLCFVSLASADFYYEVEIKGGMDAKGPEIGKNYVSATGMRMDSGSSNAMILNFKKGVFYQLNTTTKSYTEKPFEQLMNPEGADKEQAERMAQMFEQMMSSMKINKTDETQKIGEWNCTKYVVEGMGMQSEYWVTQDVKNYKDLSKYLDKYKAVFDKSPILKQLSSSFEMQRKMDGFPIKTVNKVMGMEIVSMVKKVESKKISDDVFMPPKDYKKGTEEVQQ